MRVDNPLGTPTFTQEFVNIGDIDSVAGDLPDAPQSGTLTRIEVNDRRALDCVARDNRAWLTAAINPNAGADIGETTAHWFKLNTSAVPSPITLDDQGNIGGEDIAPDTTTFYPSLAVDSLGNAKFGFSASTPTIFAGAFVAGRVATDPAGTVGASETVKTGEDFYVRTSGTLRNRWGDYSGISLHPVDESCWVFNEFTDTRGTVISGEDGRWGTAWGHCALTPPITCNGLTPTLMGTDGIDILIGTAGPDVIFAGGGNDVISGAAGDDTICAGAGKDFILGADGNDTMFGDAGDDVIFGGSGINVFDGGTGNDICVGSLAVGDTETGTGCEVKRQFP